MPELSVVVPVFNERDNILPLLGEIAAALRTRADFEIAAAKLRANRAVGVVTAIAHQVHGAIGFTREYVLHRVTIPLMRWRSMHGSDAYWAERLGRQVAGFGGRGLWEALTARAE